jgi:uncharacterized protein YbjT (DUF2867 family)
MKIAVIGANGLIGSALVSALHGAGHEVVGAGRTRPSSLPLGVAGWVSIDFARTSIATWAELLKGCDALINCVGVLQDNVTDSVEAAHASGAEALFAACQRAGVKRVIHFSAIGVDQHQASPFSRTKFKGEEVLRNSDLDWIIVRPSVVLGRGVFGASALFRGLSALPILPVLPGTGELQVVTLDDVLVTVLKLLEPDAQPRTSLDLAGRERMTMTEIVALLRKWHGWRPARIVPVPAAFANILYSAGDAVSTLGWRPPIRSTVAREMVHGATGESGGWEQQLGRAPVSLRDWLLEHPANVQDRWFAKLYFLKPVLISVLAAFWVATGVISLTVGYKIGVGLMLDGGAGPLAGASVVAGALADIAIGIAIAVRRTSWYGLWGAIGLSLFYAAAGTVLLPELWREPLGPLLKIWPILAAHLVALAILEER